MSESDSLDAQVLAMCGGIRQLQDPETQNVYAHEVNEFPHELSSDYAWNIKTGLDRDRFDWVGRELGRAMIAGVDLHPSVEVLLGHNVGVRVVFGACLELLQARGISEAELRTMYESDDAVHTRDFRAWLNNCPENPMTFADFVTSLVARSPEQTT